MIHRIFYFEDEGLEAGFYLVEGEEGDGVYSTIYPHSGRFYSKGVLGSFGFTEVAGYVQGNFDELRKLSYEEILSQRLKRKYTYVPDPV